MIEKIISGGQTGVDQAALDIAIKFNIPHGGWCPKGRIAENGMIPLKYLLTETESSDYSIRTKLNIRDSDGTLILVPENLAKITSGTMMTIQVAKEKEKPYFIAELAEAQNIQSIVDWVYENNIKILNVAGPRESHYPGINQLSVKFLEKIIPFLLVRMTATEQ